MCSVVLDIFPQYRQRLDRWNWLACPHLSYEGMGEMTRKNNDSHNNIN